MEFGAPTCATTLVLRLCCDWFVRYAWIGRLLNGRRGHPKRSTLTNFTRQLDRPQRGQLHKVKSAAAIANEIANGVPDEFVTPGDFRACL